MKYNIGDKVWWASHEQNRVHRVCPDCFGKLSLTVILGDGSQVSIPCTTCAKGYEPPIGIVYDWKFCTRVVQSEILRVEIEKGKENEYRISDNFHVKESELFATKEEAEAKAIEFAEELNHQEEEKIKSKVKPHRDWAWHVTHHRQSLKRANEEVVYHTAKLNYAKSKAKE